MRLAGGVLAVFALLAGQAVGAREEFRAAQGGGALGVWRITDEPAIRHWANYHNTQCWSPRGRYLCYTRYAHAEGRYGDALDEVHVYDAHKDEDRLVERGFFPRWARSGDRLYYVRLVDPPGGKGLRAPEVRCLDVGTGESRTLAAGVENLGETTHDDRWLIGARRFRGQEPEFVTVRIALPGGKIEELRDVVGSQLMPNPRHPVFFTRDDHKSQPFGATRWFYDLEGKNQRMGVPTVQQYHMSWLGDGGYLLLGNGLVRGRRWDEPYPSNVHFLAAVTVGDISPCGQSGRYVCGDERVADLRSGDGWDYIDPLSIICYPASVKDDSGIYDADPKGSPDGTKVCFVSNYDLKIGPVTEIEDYVSRDEGMLRVKSTAGFPESGALVVQREVIGYARKSATAFEGITRELHGTLRCSPAPGRLVTSFEARCLGDAAWGSIPGAPPAMRKSLGDGHPELLRQRQTDVYVGIVRQPDRPVLRAADDAVQLIPGEEHREIRGHLLLRGEKRVTAQPLVPGATIPLDAGEYRAVAVEWSGLESEPGPPLQVAKASHVTVLADAPKDFSWTGERWLVGGREAPAPAAKAAPDAIRETVHLLDGVIQREWYQKGSLALRHDLNAAGKAIRRQTFRDGKLALREFFGPDGRQVSKEIFDAGGFVAESIRYAPKGDPPAEDDHWWYERGTPVRRVSGRDEFVKRGEDWAGK